MAPPPEVPARIGRYPVAREIGRGGMGTIYEARDPELDRRIAIKVPPRQMAADPEGLRRFEREAKTLAALNHPNIVTIHSVEEEDDVPFLTMELVEGETLEEAVPEDGVPLDRFFAIAEAVTEALAAAHARGVVHRDLKPKNVMVSAEDRVKVLDFGLARLVPAEDSASEDTVTLLTQQRQVMGTVPYMSPEQALGESVDTRTDLWALGVLFYEMLTGERPFQGTSGTAVVQAILHDEPSPVRELRDGVPEALGRIVKRCLAKDPDARYAGVDALLEDLRLCRQSEPNGGANEDRVPCLAVLPFETLGADEASIFAEGIHGDLLTRLSNVSGLEVISRTSVRNYRDTRKTLAEISAELDASWVLEGEVQQAADQVQVNVRLVKAPSDRQIWAERFRRGLTAEKLFEIQGEITERIADALKIRLTPEEKRRVQWVPTENLDAYHLYVEGRAHMDQRTEEGLRRGLECFRRATAEDPDYALAWAGLADTLSLFRFYAYEAPEGVKEPMEAARRAVELDPNLGEARASLGILLAIRHEGPPAVRELERAVGLTPSYAEAHGWLAWTRLCLGDPEAGLVAARRAVELDPLAPAYRAYLAELFLANGEGEEALQEARRAREINPEYGLAHFMEGLVLYHLGRLDEATVVLERVFSLVPSDGTPSHAEIRAVLAAAHAARGDRAEVRELGDRIEGDETPFSSGLVRAVLGDEEAALTAFESVDDWGSFSVDHLRYFFPEVLGPLRKNPRFEGLLRKVNLSWGLKEADPERGAVSDLIGREVSHYRVLERLGGGGMGEVFKAEDLRLERRVALKFLPPELGDDPVAKERFMQEAKAASALNHENICTIHDIDETDDGRLFIAMAFYEGETLKKRLAAGPLAIDEALEVAEQTAQGLVKAHRKGIVHRDIKPANVMITRDGVVKIVDFGLAKLAEGPGLTKTGTSVGTPAYMSPEQAKGEEVDHRTDLWSLGVVLWEMLIGRRPFRGKSDAQILHAILYEDPPDFASSRARIPAEVQHLLARLLAREPGDRCSTAREALELVRAARERASAVQEQAAKRTGAAEAAEAPEAPTLTWPGRSKADTESEPGRSGGRRAVLVGGLVLLVLVGVFAGWWWFGGPDEAVTDSEAETRAEESRAQEARSEETAMEGPAASETAPEASHRKRIVVLPFENLGPPDHEYFAAGMAEEITSRLASVKDLGVIARTSALQYENTDKSMEEIGNELDVRYALEGSVRWAPTEGGPGRVRITPQLIRVADETHLWANTYDATLEDIFSVQSEIARKVIDELEVVISGRETLAVEARPTENLAAYHAYLEGQHHRERSVGSAEDIEAAVESFERAVEHDPGFSLAWSELAKARAGLYHWGIDRSPSVCRGALRAAEQALALDPGLAETHLAMAQYHYWCNREYDRALEAIDRAREGAPDASSVLLTLKAAIQRRQGRWRESTESFESAMELDPRNARLAESLADNAYALRDYSDALRFADRAIAVDPHYVFPYALKSWILFSWRGSPRAAEEIVHGAPDPTKLARSTRILWLRLAGENEQALELAREIGPRYFELVHIRYPIELVEGEILEEMGRRSEARSSYEEALERLQEDLSSRTTDPQIHAAAGLAHAGLGRRDRAIRHGKRAVELLPVSRDALRGPEYLKILAAIHSRIGETHEACEVIEDVLSAPAFTNIRYYDRHPAFVPLRDEPCFEEIRERHPPPTPADEAP